MTLNTRCFVKLACGFAMIGFGEMRGLAQKDEKKPDAAVRFVSDEKWRRVLNVAREVIKDGDWKDAVVVLQAVLDEPRDSYVQTRLRHPTDAKKEIIRWASVKREANALIASMPADGLAAYEAMHGKAAQKMFDNARKKKDDALLVEVVLRYRYTRAGGEAYALLVKSKAFDAPKLDGWPSWRGNAANTLLADAAAPLLDKQLWSRPIHKDKLDGFKEMDEDDLALKAIEAAVMQVIDLKQPVLPGFFPIATQGMVIYRTQRDIRAVALKDIAIKDEESGFVFKARPGHLVWKALPMRPSLAVLLEKNLSRLRADAWIKDYNKVPGFNRILYENSLIGTMSADDKHVYAISDLSVPPHPAAFMPNPLNPQPLAMGELKPLVMQNELHAYDLESGKLKWDLTQHDGVFKDSHFLSPPVRVGGKLYVLNERLINPVAANLIGGDSELRLVCIDANKLVEVNSSIKPKIESILVLANLSQENRFVQNLRRRVHAATPAYADGILVCPTNSGEVLGIDLLTRRLAWSYGYRESAPLPIVLPGMKMPKGDPGTTQVSQWQSAPPAVADAKVVFTAPDADSIHCIDLKTGMPVWQKPRQEGDRYFAGVFDGRVLIVNEKSIRALDLPKGKELWKLDTGDLPSGQGVAGRGIYYLPLAKEIMAVDIVQGIVKAHHRVAAGATPPGNIVFYRDMLLSQTTTEMSAYRLLKDLK